MGKAPSNGQGSRVEVELASEPAAVGRARAAVVPLRDSLSDDIYGDLRLVISELVSNAVLHGPGTSIRLAVAIDGETVRGEVADDGDGAVEVRTRANGAGGGGHGLTIVDSLADRWGVYVGSTHVWFELSA